MTTAATPPVAFERISRSPAETEEIGVEVARTIRPGDVVYLLGALGSGKTCFARGLARGLGAPDEQVASPTFAIVHEYAAADGRIRLRHLDLYRIADRVRELQQIGVPDALEGAPVAVEWPGEAVSDLLPATVEVEIERTGQGERRIRVERKKEGTSPSSFDAPSSGAD